MKNDSFRIKNVCRLIISEPECLYAEMELSSGVNATGSPII